MKELVNTYSSWTFRIGVILAIFSTLFLFTNFTTDFYEPAKFLSLLAVTGILLILLMLKFTLNGKVTWVRTPLDIPLILLLAVAIVSTIMSPSPYVSGLGFTNKIHGSLASMATYIVFYFIVVNFLKKSDIKFFLYFILGLASLLATISLLAYAGLKLLPPPWSHGINFTPAGSNFSATAVLAMLLPVLIINILRSTNISIRIINSFILALFGVTIALTGNMATWIASGFALLISYLVANPIKDFKTLTPESLKSLSLLGLPLIITAIFAIGSYLPIPNNILAMQKNNFPREIQLPFTTSWKVSVSSFRDSPFWGTGPSTYLFNFTSYKPIEFNSSQFWNIRFESGFNEYLQVLATLGGVGIVALLSATAMFASVAFLAIRHGDSQKTALAISGLTFFVLLALYPSTMVLWVIGILIIALFFALSFTEDNVSTSTSKNFGHLLVRLTTSVEPSIETIKIEALPSVLLIISFALTLFVFFFAGKFALADYYHRLALNSVSQNQLLDTYNHLVSAEKLNPVNDMYRTDLAQANLALANALITAKGPTEASPAGSLTEQDRTNVTTLLQQTINEGRVAVTLSPRSVVNWQILGLLYRQIAGVANDALSFSLDSYGKAIYQDPLDPVLRLNVGGVYYAIANYDLAIRFFTDAINLKPDYANGYYNLSVAYREKGDLNAAVAVAERTLELVDANSEDHKAVSGYLADLKNRISSGSAQQSSIEAPASQAEGSVEGKNLPKVEVEKTEKVATPPAVKKPNSTPEPTPAP